MCVWLSVKWKQFSKCLFNAYLLMSLGINAFATRQPQAELYALQFERNIFISSSRAEPNAFYRWSFTHSQTNTHRSTHRHRLFAALAIRQIGHTIANAGINCAINGLPRQLNLMRSGCNGFRRFDDHLRTRRISASIDARWKRGIVSESITSTSSTPPGAGAI